MYLVIDVIEKLDICPDNFEDIIKKNIITFAKFDRVKKFENIIVDIFWQFINNLRYKYQVEVDVKYIIYDINTVKYLYLVRRGMMVTEYSKEFYFPLSSENYRRIYKLGFYERDRFINRKNDYKKKIKMFK